MITPANIAVAVATHEWRLDYIHFHSIFSTTPWPNVEAAIVEAKHLGYIKWVADQNDPDEDGYEVTPLGARMALGHMMQRIVILENTVRRLQHGNSAEDEY